MGSSLAILTQHEGSLWPEDAAQAPETARGWAPGLVSASGSTGLRLAALPRSRPRLCSSVSKARAGPILQTQGGEARGGPLAPEGWACALSPCASPRAPPAGAEAWPRGAGGGWKLPGQDQPSGHIQLPWSLRSPWSPELGAQGDPS